MSVDPELAGKCVRLYKYADAIMKAIEDDVAGFCNRSGITLAYHDDRFEPIENARYLWMEYGVECLMAFDAYIADKETGGCKASGYVIIKPDGRLEFMEERAEKTVG